jgi:tetratricopeptide (TPR) repeat protein
MRPASVAIASFLALGASALTSPATASTPRELFQSGNSAYEQGKFQEAADAYEKIIAYGVVDPRVLYNLANAEFKLGRLGAAILHYERALRLDPSDRDVRDNLEFARGLIRDRVPESEIPYPVKAVKVALDAVPADLLMIVFLCLYYVTAGLVGALPLVTRDVRRRVLAYGAAAAGLCALLAGGALLYTIQGRTAAHAIVMTDRVDVLSGPSADNTVLFTVHEGTRLEVRNRRDGWYQVSLPNAMSGWVPSASVERV